MAVINLISVGHPNPVDPNMAEILWKIDKDKYICRKVIYKNNKLTAQ
ncbi:MAG: hypothetical protein ACTSRZ_21185 [Promethearchaeota archaeon]